MTFKQSMRNAYASRVQALRASRRDKSRPQSRHRFLLRTELLEDRLVPTILLVNSLADSGTGTLRDAILASVNQQTDGLGQKGTGNDTIQFDPSIDGGAISLTTFANDLSAGTNAAGRSAFFINNGDNLVIDGQTGLTKGITIQGGGPSAVTTFRLFDVDPSASLILEGLTLSGGFAQGQVGGHGIFRQVLLDSAGGSGGGGAAGLGGAIFNQGTLTILDSTLTGNIAQGGNGGDRAGDEGPGSGGGGLGTYGYNAGVHVGGCGGGPNNGASGSYSGGSGGNGAFGGGGGAGGFGGGGGGGGSTEYGATDNDFKGQSGGNGGFGGGGGGAGHENQTGDTPGNGGYAGGDGGEGGGGGGGAGMGGAIFNEGGTVVITNSTITDNSAFGGIGGMGVENTQYVIDGKPGEGLGGGLFNRNGTITVTNSTFAANVASAKATAGDGGGIFSLGDSNQNTTSSTVATATINNTIIIGSNRVSDLKVTTHGGTATVSGQANLIPLVMASAPGVTNNLGVSTIDPLLDPNGLQYNGGLTQTIALQTNSPAIGTGSLSVPNLPDTDQRGVPRNIYDGPVDIGAYQTYPFYNIVVNTTDATDPTGENLTLPDAIGLANDSLQLSQLSAAGEGSGHRGRRNSQHHHLRQRSARHDYALQRGREPHRTIGVSDPQPGRHRRP